MESSRQILLNISPRSNQIYEVNLTTTTCNSTKLKNSLVRSDSKYKVLCQISDEKLLCYSYSNQDNRGRIFYIDKYGNITHGSWFYLFSTIGSEIANIFYCNSKGIRYKNSVYIMSDRCCILRYNLLKNSCSKCLNTKDRQCYSWAMVEDKILVSSPNNKDFIYDCNINSISFVFDEISWFGKFVGAADRKFFTIDIGRAINISEQLNPYKWTIIGRITLWPWKFISTSSLSHENFVFILSNMNLYKFDLTNLYLTKYLLNKTRKEAIPKWKILSLKFISFENENKLNSWVPAFRSIEHYFKNCQKCYIEKILRMVAKIDEDLTKYAFERPIFEERKVIIILNYYFFDMSGYLKHDPELFKYNKKEINIFRNQAFFCQFSLKKWSKQGVIMPNIIFMKNNHVKDEEIIEAFKKDKKGLIWVLIGKFSRPYIDFINQNEDKVIISYSPSDNAFRRVNEYLREAGEKEIDWKIWD